MKLFLFGFKKRFFKTFVISDDDDDEKRDRERSRKWETRRRETVLRKGSGGKP